jgi:hypothetical protein
MMKSSTASTTKTATLASIHRFVFMGSSLTKKSSLTPVSLEWLKRLDAAVCHHPRLPGISCLTS